MSDQPARLRPRPRPRLPLLVGAGRSTPSSSPAARHRGLGLRRQPLPRLLEPARQRQHRAPASEGRGGDPGAGGACCRRRARDTRTSRAARRPKRILAKAGPQLRQGLLHQRRCGRQRERDPDGAPHDRPRQGALDLPLATTATRARRSSRPATGGACRTSSPAATCTSSARSSTAPSSGRRRPSRSRERALHHLERVIQSEGAGVDRRDPARGRARHRRRARAAARLPRGRARAVRPATASC